MTQCSHAPLTVDDTLDAMSLTHDAFVVEFRSMVATRKSCEVCGRPYFDEGTLIAHRFVRHGVVAVAK